MALRPRWRRLLRVWLRCELAELDEPWVVLAEHLSPSWLWGDWVPPCNRSAPSTTRGPWTTLDDALQGRRPPCAAARRTASDRLGPTNALPRGDAGYCRRHGLPGLRLGRGLDTLLDRTVAPGLHPDRPGGPPPAARLAGRPGAGRPGRARSPPSPAPPPASGSPPPRAWPASAPRCTWWSGTPTRARGSATRSWPGCPGPPSVVDRCDVSDLDDVRRFVDEAGLDAARRARPQRRRDARDPHRVRAGPRDDDGAAPARPGADDRPAAARAGRARRPGRVRDLGRDVRPAAARRRPGVPQRGVLADHRLRPQQAGPGRAAADPGRALGAGGVVVGATHPGWADTPGVETSLPTFHKLTGPLLRDAEGGADTTVWLAATEPAPASGLLWHDRRDRPTHLMSRTRTGETEREQMWEWCREAAGLDGVSR